MLTLQIKENLNKKLTINPTNGMEQINPEDSMSPDTLQYIELNYLQIFTRHLQTLSFLMNAYYTGDTSTS